MNSMTDTNVAVVTFDRIGRNHNVAPLTLDVQPGPQFARAERLIDAIYDYARPHLGSRDVSVEVGLADDGSLTGHGWICCGMRNGGNFTIAEAVSA